MPPFIDSRPPPGPGPDPGQEFGFGPSSFNPFLPPLPHPFPSKGRYDPPPPPPPPSFNTNNFGNLNFGAQPSSFNRSSTTNNQPSSNLFGSQTATLPRQRENIAAPKDDISIQIDDTICEQPDLELGSGLIDTLGVEANDLLDADFITKEEENDAVLDK